MSTVPIRRYTPEEYLALERAAPYKSEYYAGEIFAMSGAREPHNLIAVNLITALGNALAGSDCRVYPSDMRVKCPSGLYTYPDLSIVCGKSQVEDDHGDNLLNPLVIFEILSPSTEGYDRGKKFEHYRTLKSLREYILVAQDHASIEQAVLSADGSGWKSSVLSRPEDCLTLDSCKVSIPLAAIYRNIVFPPSTIADIHPFTVFPNGAPPR